MAAISAPRETPIEIPDDPVLDSKMAELGRAGEAIERAGEAVSAFDKRVTSCLLVALAVVAVCALVGIFLLLLVKL